MVDQQFSGQRIFSLGTELASLDIILYVTVNFGLVDGVSGNVLDLENALVTLINSGKMESCRAGE